MAAVMPRVSVSKTSNSKLYKWSPTESMFSNKNPINQNSGLEKNPRTARSSSPSTYRLQNKGPGSAYNSHTGIALERNKNKNKNNCQESGGHENEFADKMESYGVQKAEETTEKINDCLKVAEEIREDATRTLVNLHQQGEQITRTHLTAASIDYDLSKGEKLLGSLGGLFSKTWKPKKTREIKGPVLTRVDSFIKRADHIEQRQKLGLNPRRSQSNPRRIPSQPSSAFERVQMEKEKQNAAASDLGNILAELKTMAVDMGSEIDRQNEALGYMKSDVDELNMRIRVANLRARHLLRE
ncbi:SNAP25 homologous protein SNAP33-like [Phalaenopsis equestris]|uniref:SNAP25 homologous protein SNAP33-like n=1 Tax=Phalaenopsis equestris TaxID=78828 RepID=UPI0009E3CB1F|nr:SNAP25 homologous protein SNAP33-like [Phalaenopsis equestris]